MSHHKETPALVRPARCKRATGVAGRKRTGPPKGWPARNRSRDARLVADAMRRIELPNATRRLTVALFKLWQAVKGGPFCSVAPSVPALAKKLRVSDRTIQRGLRQIEDCGALIEVDAAGLQTDRHSPDQVKRPKGGGAPTRYFLHTRQLYMFINGKVPRPSDELRDALMFRAWVAPPWWETPIRSGAAEWRPVTLPVTGTGDTVSNIRQHFQSVRDDTFAQCDGCSVTGDTESGFIEQNQIVARNATRPFPLNSPRARADLAYFSDSAIGEVDCPAGETEHLAATACPAGTSGPHDVQDEASYNVESPLASNPDENPSITRQRDRPARAGHLEANGTSRCSPVPDAQPACRGAVELLGKMATARPSPPPPNRAQADRMPAGKTRGCPTAYAFAVLRHLRKNGDATYGATASDMGISIGDAWRAQAQLRRIGAIRFGPVGQMVPV